MAPNFFDKLHQINMKGLEHFSTQNKNTPPDAGKKKRKKQLVIYSYTKPVTLPQLLGVDISVKSFFPDLLNLPSLTVFSPWLFEWSGRSETSV